MIEQKTLCAPFEASEQNKHTQMYEDENIGIVYWKDKNKGFDFQCGEKVIDSSNVTVVVAIKTLMVVILD